MWLCVYIKTKRNTSGSHAQLDADSLYLRFNNVHFTSSVRDLEFILDPILSLSDHVNSVVLDANSSANHCLCLL